MLPNEGAILLKIEFGSDPPGSMADTQVLTRFHFSQVHMNQVFYRLIHQALWYESGALRPWPAAQMWHMLAWAGKHL